MNTVYIAIPNERRDYTKIARKQVHGHAAGGLPATPAEAWELEAKAADFTIAKLRAEIAEREALLKSYQIYAAGCRYAAADEDSEALEVGRVKTAKR